MPGLLNSSMGFDLKNTISIYKLVMKKSKKLFPVITIGLLFSLLSIGLYAQPSFSGSWKLNQNESELNTQFSMSPEKVVITQEKNIIHIIRHVNIQGQSVAVDEKFTLDGKECKNDGFQGSSKLSTVNWSDDKNSLIVVTTIEGNFGTIDTKQIYSMMDDKLKVVSSFSSNQGDSKETWILEKGE